MVIYNQHELDACVADVPVCKQRLIDSMHMHTNVYALEPIVTPYP